MLGQHMLNAQNLFFLTHMPMPKELLKLAYPHVIALVPMLDNIWMVFAFLS